MFVNNCGNTVVSYIIHFLIGESNAEKWQRLIGYTADQREFHQYGIVIVPASSICFPTSAPAENDMPALPLTDIEGVPLLFGRPVVEWAGETLVVYADIIASSFFLLSRYEEMRRRGVRDRYGRFPGKESLPCKAGFIHRPVVDEYGRLLRGWLRRTGVDVPEPEPGIRKIWLTHDVDEPFFCRTFRNVLREAVKGAGIGKAWRLFKGPLEADPFYTFPWIVEQDNRLQKAVGRHRCEPLFFIKGGGRTKQDRPVYNLHSADMQSLLAISRTEQVGIGLHSSYSAGKNPVRIAAEKERLQKATGMKIHDNRHHYLSLCEPEDCSWLERAGITDDFTMGYADVAGFRLGTCRPVRWINPATRSVSSLTLHPLTVMDVSLSDPRYMHLAYDEALEYCLQLFDRVARSAGELVLLWHNNTVTGERTFLTSATWHRKLYETLIQELAKQ
ncbi:MAG: polysaccharide deacetylase family protein [Tannerellaceae bacterium]|jgi:hypothetical protein|nr:polysaccharide deacetylase family protein [Tannerellaceae bacterium]